VTLTLVAFLAVIACSSACGFAASALLGASKIKTLRHRVYTLANEVERRVLEEIGEDLDRTNAHLKACARALGWEPQDEPLERFLKRVPTPKVPTILLPDGATGFSFPEALTRWQQHAPQALEKAQKKHSHFQSKGFH